jgi:hypothetical protein
MTLGRVIYEDYKKNILLENYSIYYKEWDKNQFVESIIRCIDEKYNILMYREPDHHDKLLLDTIEIGDKEVSYTSYKNSKTLAHKYEERHLNNLFTIMLYFRHNTICQYLNIVNDYEYKLHHYVTFFDMDKSIIEQVYFHYNMLLLNQQNYTQPMYSIYMNPVIVRNLNIEPKTMGFFQKEDIHKTLLIYMSGGIGDNIMYSRFIKQIAQMNHNIIFLVYDNLFWIYEYIYRDCLNVDVVPFCDRGKITKFDYHCNVSYLHYALELDYKDIYIDYFPELPSYPVDVLLYTKPIMVINWKGNSDNSHERHNRSIPLSKCIPLFECNHIQWITITQDITSEEQLLLDQYNVKSYSLDQSDESFRYSISILKQIQGMITTDTSLAHLCGTLGINTYVLLSAGCDWRWTKNKTTNWYPNVTLIRQSKPFEWNLDELIHLL